MLRDSSTVILLAELGVVPFLYTRACSAFEARMFSVDSILTEPVLIEPGVLYDDC